MFKLFFIFLIGLNQAHASAITPEDRACLRLGLKVETPNVAGHARKYLYMVTRASRIKGAIVILHGGGGQAAHFCNGGRGVQPQIAFTREALRRGYAVYLVDSTHGVVTDNQGRDCGKRFDFSVLPRANVDLPLLGYIFRTVIPRDIGRGTKIFVTGLSTGGYMTIRAATHFNNWVTAFAPVAAGDPYGTDAVCDPNLSPREDAKGILVDRETRREIVENNACLSRNYPNESLWEGGNPRIKPTVQQFHHEDDGIVDVTCMQKADHLLKAHGYRGGAPYIVRGPGGRNPLKHLWQVDYNVPILNFFDSFSL